MAELDAKRYKLIIEALEYKVRNKDNKFASRYKGWDYMGRNGIFWTARRNFPQIYNRQHPEQTYESEIKFAEAIVRAHQLKLDPVLEKFFDDVEAPTIGEQTAAIIDQAIKQEAPPPPKPPSTAAIQKTPTLQHPIPPKEDEENRAKEATSESTPPTLAPPTITPNALPESFVPIPANQPKQPSLAKSLGQLFNRQAKEPNRGKGAARESLPSERLDQLPAEPTTQSQRRFSFSRVFSTFKPAATFAGGRLSTLGPGFKVLSTRVGLNLSSMGAGLLNGLSGGANGMGNLLGRGLNSSGPRLPAKYSSSLRGIANKVGGNKKWLWLLLLFLIVFIIMNGGGFFPSGLGINSCKFTNGDESLSINSSRLQGILQEVSAKSQIPSAVLASIAMHTNKDFTSSANNDNEAFSGKLNDRGTDCKSFGATREGGLGLMQVRRNDPSDPSQTGLKLGAKLAGLDNPDDPSKLTLANFCDIRINVYLAAGVLTAKNGQPPQKGSDINRTACSYFPNPFCAYGLLNKYNYGQEVQTDTERCPQGGSGGGGTIPGGSGDLSLCKFTRSGNPLHIASTILQGWIKTAADAEGISPYVLASVAMHESQEFVSHAENDHDAITSGKYPNPGKKFCAGPDDNRIDHGVKGNKDDPCTDEDPPGSRTAQAFGLMQLVDIYHTNDGDLTDIKNNLAYAAKKLKADGITKTPDQTQINDAIKKYHASCIYESSGEDFSYCDEVWDDTQRCIANQPINPGPGPIYNSPDGCIASSHLPPVLDEYEYPMCAVGNTFAYPSTPYTGNACVAPTYTPVSYSVPAGKRCSAVICGSGVTTCGPASGAMILQSIGIASSVQKVATDWQADKAFSAVGVTVPNIPGALNKEYAGQIEASYSVVHTADAVANLISSTHNPIMVSAYYDNNAKTAGGLDKRQTAGNSTDGGISLSNNGQGHMVTVWQVCGDSAEASIKNRVFINDPVLGEQYSVPTSQFNTAISLSSRGEAISVKTLNVEPPPTTTNFLKPTSGTITLCYGSTESPYSADHKHKGIDIASGLDTPIYAADIGTATVGFDPDGPGSRGNYVIINHGENIRTHYFHLTRAEVRSRQLVNKGDVIGYMGRSGDATGVHLHFAISRGGEYEYIDPSPYIDLTCKKNEHF